MLAESENPPSNGCAEGGKIEYFLIDALIIRIVDLCAVASPIRSAQTIRLPATTAMLQGCLRNPPPAPILKEHLTFAALFRAI
ncbi:hypothetical protein TNCV_813471 [Trichonephila clavipes]|nr:hypothetical protein TNCV_813471 [Trichonephila clavipes]